MSSKAGTSMVLPAVVLLLVGVSAFGQDAQHAPAAAERVAEGLAALYRADSVTADGMLVDLTGQAELLEIRAGASSLVTLEDDAVVFGAPVGPVVPGVFSLWPAASLITAIKQSGQLTIEAWLSSATTEQAGPGRIVSISRDSSSRNVTLGQDQSQFVLRLRTSATGEQGTPELQTPEGTVVPGELQHVVVTFDAHRAIFYVDGERVSDTIHFGGEGGIGTLQIWDEAMHLMFGNEFDGNRQWSGALRLVAFYKLALSPDEVRQNFQAGPD